MHLCENLKKFLIIFSFISSLSAFSDDYKITKTGEIFVEKPAFLFNFINPETGVYDFCHLFRSF